MASTAAIRGLGMTSLGRVYGATPRRLAASAVRLAAADAGMSLADLDGLLICPGITGGLDVGLAAVLGLRDLSLLAVVNSFGASAVTAVQVAAQAVTSGTARAIACVFADAPLREGVPAGSAFGSHSSHSSHSSQRTGSGAPPPLPERHGLSGLTAGYGFRSINVYYALAARRHMQAYGTTSEQFGAVAVAQRQWAAGNPAAQFTEPITLADHQNSRWVAEPLHLLDCSLVSNGAIAVIVTTAEEAAAGPRPPVHVWGWGQGHPGQPMARGSEFGLRTGAVQAGQAAMNMAGVALADITMAQIYDCYTYTVLITLEDYGFCGKGEGGPFAESGALAPGGSLPVNTGGGQLSGYYMWGFTPLSEAVIQARGDGGARQSPANDLILVSGNGGILAHHGTLIVSPHLPHLPLPQHSPRSAAPSDAATPVATPAARLTPADHPPADIELAGQDDIGIVRADARSEPFFAGAAAGQLMIRRCEPCGTWLAPTASGCPDCGADAGELSWAAASGHGTLVSWSVVHPRDGGPVALPALVELDEGPWLSAGLRLDGPGDLIRLRAGLPVTAEFARAAEGEGEAYPLFRLAGSPG